MRPERDTATQAGLGEFILHRVSPERRATLLRNGIERIVNSTPCNYPPDFPEKVHAAVLLGGAVEIENHTRNSDIPVGIKIASNILRIANEVLPEDRQFKGFVEPYAYSLQSGTQGEMSTFYSDVLPLLQKWGLEEVPTPTDSDLTKGRVTQAEFEMGRTKSSRRMATAVLRDHKFIVLAPEATVKGGEINPITGKIYGMQQFVPGAVYESLKIAARRTGYATLFPVGVSYGYRVLNSRNGMTLEATLVGLGFFPHRIMEANVGEPILFTAAEIEVLGPSLIDLRAGKATAQLLKPDEQGFYAEAA